MKDNWIARKPGATSETLGRAVMCKILAFIGEYLLAHQKVEEAKWALSPVKVEEHVEVIRR